MVQLRIAIWIFAATSLGGCAQSTAPLSCPFAIMADFPVTYTLGHAPVVTVQIRGQNLRMMVDSGSGVSSITDEAYHKLDLTDTSQIHGYATGVAGTVQDNVALMEDIGFGGNRLKHQDLLVNDDSEPRDHGRPTVDGVIGDDILESFNVGYDLPHNRITLYQWAACGDHETPWAGDYDEETISRNQEDFDSTFPLLIDNQPIAAVIDTGSEQTTIMQSRLTRLGIKPEAVLRIPGLMLEGIGAKRIVASRERFANITIGAESFDNATTTVVDSPLAQFDDALLGDDYLAHHQVYVANADNLVYFGLSVPSH